MPIVGLEATYEYIRSLFLKATASMRSTAWVMPADCKNGTVWSPHPSLAAQLMPGKVNKV
jgi:hypothetical protein